MKIVVISSQVFVCPPPGYSGLEMVAWQTAKGLAAKGHEVVLVAPDGSSCPGCQMFHTGPAGGFDEKDQYGKYWQILPNFDCVIDHTWQKWPFSLKREGRLQAPILSVLHAPVDTMLRELPPGIDKPCFVCISDDQAAHFRALFNHDVRRCYNGVDLDFYRPMGIKRSDRFLFLGRFSSIKGADLAIDACIKAGVGLDLVGDTSITNEPEYHAQCQAKCDGKRIRMVGPASRGECVWWYSQAHCLIHANKRFREPFGLAPVEAMACGCPVIAWDNGAMRETVKFRTVGITNGRLVKTEDELFDSVRYAAFPDPAYDGERIADACRENLREWVSQFSVQKSADRYEELCHEALAGGW